jgi:membrane protein YfhO
VTLPSPSRNSSGLPTSGTARWAALGRVLAGPLLIVVAVVVVLNGLVLQPKIPSQHPDILGFWLPTYCFLGKSLAAGHIPAWNPHVMGGLPFAADPQSGWMYLPAMLLFGALPCGVAIRVMIVLQPVLGGLGLYGFLRSEGLSRPAATTGGLALSLALAASRLGLFLPFPSAFAWTAVLLWACSALLKAGTWPARLGWLALAGAAWGQLAAAYSSHGLILGTVAVAFYIAAKAWQAARQGTRSWGGSFALTALLAVAFVGVNLAFFLPRLAYVSESSYGRVLAGPAQLGPAPGAAWPLKLAVAPGGYLGIAALVLSFAAFSSRRYRPLAVAFGVYGALSYLLGVGGVASAVARITEGVPVLNFFAHFPGRLSLGLLLALPILAALGVEAWTEAGRARDRVLMVAPGALVFVVLPMVLGAGWARLIIPAVGAAGGGIALVAVARRPRLAALIPVVLVCELTTAGLVGQTSGPLGASRAYSDDLFGTRTTNWLVPMAAPDINVESYLRPGPVAQALKRSDSRYLSLDPAEALFRGYLTLQDPDHWGLMANQRAMLFGLHDAQGYNPVQLERYWRYMRATSGGELAYNTSVFRRRPSTATMNLLHVESVVAPVGQGPEGWHSVTQEGRWVVYRTPSLTAQSWVLTDVRVVEDPEASLRAVTAPDFDPTSTVVLEVDPARLFGGIANRGGAGLGGPQRDRRPQTEILPVEAPAPAVVLVRIPYARNWHATVDGQPARIFPADHFLMGVPVQSGSHTIGLTYDDPWIGYGLLGSLLSLLALAVAALVTRMGGPGGRQPRERSERIRLLRSPWRWGRSEGSGSSGR